MMRRPISGHRADLPGQADLAEGHELRGQRVVVHGGGQRQCGGQVGGGFAELHPADGGHVGVQSAQLHPGAGLQHRQDHCGACGVQPAGGPARDGRGGAREQGLHLGDQRPAPLEGDGDAGAGNRVLGAGDKEPRGVGQALDAALGQVEAADLVGGPVAVLQGAQQAQPGVALAVELAHHVHQVLEQPGSGNRAVLGDVADQDGGHVPSLGGVDEGGGDLADLARSPPAVPSTSAEARVCTESMISSSGSIFSTWPSAMPRSVSAVR